MKRPILFSLLALSMAVPATSHAAPPDQRRVAFWTFSGVGPQRAIVGYVMFTGGEVTLDPENSIDVDGTVKGVMWAADGLGVIFYDTGTGTWREVSSRPGDIGLYSTAAADADDVSDRGAWLLGRRPVSMLDSGTGATPPERWVSLPRADGSTPPEVSFIENGRTISRYVTAMAHHPRGGGVIAVHPYVVSGSRRTYRGAYLARVDRDLEVTERIGSFAGAKHLALSAGGTRLAYVNEAQSQVKVVSFPGLTTLRTYPAFQGAKVSFTPRGVLAISSTNREVFRDQEGDRLDFTIGGVSRLRFAPCVGDGCLSFA